MANFFFLGAFDVLESYKLSKTGILEVLVILNRHCAIDRSLLRIPVNSTRPPAFCVSCQARNSLAATGEERQKAMESNVRCNVTVWVVGQYGLWVSFFSPMATNNFFFFLPK